MEIDGCTFSSRECHVIPRAGCLAYFPVLLLLGLSPAAHTTPSRHVFRNGLQNNCRCKQVEFLAVSLIENEMALFWGIESNSMRWLR